jgi:hypothetical protein
MFDGWVDQSGNQLNEIGRERRLIPGYRIFTRMGMVLLLTSIRIV